MKKLPFSTISTIPKEKIFREYDIRGIYPTDLSDYDAYVIGRALGTFFEGKAKTCVVGRDDRQSSPTLSEKFIAGLLDSGIDVVDTGVTLTPIIHFLTCTEKFDFGVNVTASHNPKEYNGFRLDYKNAAPFYGQEIKKLYQIIQDGGFAEGKGQYLERDLSQKYIDSLVSTFKINSRLKNKKVLIDCGNGAVSLFGQKIFDKIGCNLVPIMCEINPLFPQGVPDPAAKKMMNQLSKAVIKHKADIGFAFDTDGDRFGVVDELGTVYDTDKVLMLVSEFLLQGNAGGDVYFDVKCSGYLKEHIKKNRGVPHMVKTGHPYLTKCIKEGGLVGCELSGHMYFKRGPNFGYDDGLYAACVVLEILSLAKKPLSALMAKYPKFYHTNEVKINCADEKKFGIIETIVKAIKNSSDFANAEVITIDGVRVEFDQGWFLVRASNTSPYLSIRAEAVSAEELKKLRKMVEDLLVLENLDASVLTDASFYYS